MEMTSYEVWDAETGNIIGSFSTAEEVPRVAGIILGGDDQRSENNLLVTGPDDLGAAHVIARGQPCAKMAMRQVTIGAVAMTATSKS